MPVYLRFKGVVVGADYRYKWEAGGARPPPSRPTPAGATQGRTRARQVAQSVSCVLCVVGGWVRPFLSSSRHSLLVRGYWGAASYSSRTTSPTLRPLRPPPRPTQSTTHTGPQVQRRAAAAPTPTYPTAADAQQATMNTLRAQLAAKDKDLTDARALNANLKATLATAEKRAAAQEETIEAQARVIASINGAYTTFTGSMGAALATVGCCWCCCRGPASLLSLSPRGADVHACRRRGRRLPTGCGNCGHLERRPRRPPAGPRRL